MLEFKNISVTKNKKAILQNVSFSVRPHTITAIIGKNGSGKSTLISCLTGESKYKGTVFFSDEDISLLSLKQRSRLVSLLPQNLPAAPVTVEALAEMGRNPYTDIGKRLSEKDRQQIEKAIESAGITDIRRKRLTEISGGERQKAYIAMVLSQNTRVIALDEPTTYMDVQVEKAFMSLVRELKEKHKKTLLVVMHDLSAAAEIADNILLLDEGKVKKFGETEAVIESGAIEETFGVARYECELGGEKRIIFR
ncbi:MAG: ABC transporter ATP-binding protein [Clostridia bacterium]|nr:ABC transporter ATP-binding protein [Clostridia bacterium]